MTGKRIPGIIFAVCLVIVLVVMSMATGCSSSTTTTATTSSATTSTPPAAGTKTITIGSVWDQTGSGADAEVIMKKGEDVARDYINSHGGIKVNGGIL